MVASRSPVGENPPVPAQPSRDRGPDPGWVGLPCDSRLQERPSHRSVLLFSGGLDSLCAWYLLGKPDALYVRTRSPWAERELDTILRLRATIPDLGVTITDQFPIGATTEPDGHIPYRNLSLVLEAARLGWDTINLGALKGETSRDKTDRFATETGNLLSYLEGRDVKIVLPFRSLTKTQLVRRFRDLPVPHGDKLLRSTRSCYDPDSFGIDVGCGRCLACLRRWVAMANNGLTEPYRSDPRAYAESLATGGEAVTALKRYLPRATTFGELRGIVANHRDLRKAMRS
jgi:7-cyano-7-deazaguanine synthase